ncbi:myosin light chain kinase, smooth muscle-like isoform X1 [Syngnathoides biaculeatus]|uniref:myosin light chain kinase, smooth muscle-like isoform X1 n=1 Tax=Syngnathoides biaculeatus TaxID=300417 RepID=UPI002ADE02A9|nr:myosin light chain kinase, smooth muscle-like isoform X1 [Syngnathoides biaculeatus]
MDQDGGEPKTYVSTARLQLGGRARNRPDPLAGDTAMRNAAGGFRPTGEKFHPQESNAKNGTATTLSCNNSSGSHSGGAGLHIKDTKKSRSPDAMELKTENVEAPGKESGRRTEAEAGSSVDFLDPPEHVAVRVGEEARLRCDFRTSSVPVACCWIFNRGKAVLPDPRMSVSGDDAHSTLSISEAHPEDTGSYTLIARNRNGSSEHTVSLSVIHRPDPPASHPVVSQLSAESLVLSWTGPSFDGGTAVLGYIVEVRRLGADASGDWTEIAERCKNTSTQVGSGLEPYGKYRFRVRAYNAEGVSEPSQESDCVTMATIKEKKDDVGRYVKVAIDTKRELQDHYNVHEKLGVGKFGEVFRLSHKESGEVYAGKFYRAKSAKERSAARQEIELMNCLHHPKLVQCLAAYEAPTETVMVMEYIAGGELFERIVDDNFEHTEPTSAGYMRQILEGMLYVHKQNIVHLDLKPENIVCTDHTGTCIKIIDFGLASKLEEGKPLMVMHGTPEFVAPEVISYESVGVETDMWSIGVICFILLSGESPFQGNSDAETFALVTAARYKFDPESFDDISEQAKDFISGLLMKERRSRMSCIEALVHPWMAAFTSLNRRPTKSLRKEKMRRFLAKCKWKKTGKAVLALQRMSNLYNRPDSPGTTSDEPSWSREAEEAIRSLDKQLHGEPRFREPLRDASLPAGATARLACRVDGYPHPEVKWLKDDDPIPESARAQMEYGEDGGCSLVLSAVDASDAGVYVCRASNQVGAASCSARLEVDT